MHAAQAQSSALPRHGLYPIFATGRDRPGCSEMRPRVQRRAATDRAFRSDCATSCRITSGQQRERTNRPTLGRLSPTLAELALFFFHAFIHNATFFLQQLLTHGHGSRTSDLLETIEIGRSERE